MKRLQLKDNWCPRFHPLLASEIGLNESLLLLQLEYWLDKKAHIRDGMDWTYQSLNDLVTTFPCWNKSTINRAIHSLLTQGLIYCESKYNKRANDRTRWFALNLENCGKLESVKVLTLRQNEPTLYQNEPTLYQNATALPKTSLRLPNTEESARNTEPEQGQEYESEDTSEDLDLVFDSWLASGFEEAGPQPYLLPSLVPRKTRLRADPIPASLHDILYRVCYRAETVQEVLLLNSNQRGKVASALGKLASAGINLGTIHLFEAWWNQNWRSRDRATDQYQAPRPEQVTEHWSEAMKSGVKPKVDKPVEKPKPTHGVPDLGAIMRTHRKQQ